MAVFVCVLEDYVAFLGREEIRRGLVGGGWVRGTRVGNLVRCECYRCTYILCRWVGITDLPTVIPRVREVGEWPMSASPGVWAGDH